jgi:hypothetical protein
MMKTKGKVLTVTLCVACGLAAIALVSRGQEKEVTILEPKQEAPPPAPTPAPAAPALAAPAAAGIPGAVPVGAVVAWLKSFTNAPALPAEWVECNGQPLNLPGSPYHGMTVPNLNGAGDQPKRFLRGSAGSGDVGGAESHNHGFLVIDRPTKRTVNVASKEPGSNLPPYYEVTWILKVR